MFSSDLIEDEGDVVTCVHISCIFVSKVANGPSVG
jgi:hypothetical protein